MDLHQIRQHWEKAGEGFALSHTCTPTTRDPHLGHLEEAEILGHLQRDHLVIDVGCGDASHTLNYARKVRFIRGLDVAESLIRLARERMKSNDVTNMDFMQGSVLDVGNIFRDNPANCFISQRCLINLPNWAYQREAILQIHDRLLKGGIFLMSEGFHEELVNLNQVRQTMNLAPIQVVEYNRNLRHSEFDEFISCYFTVEKVVDYGLYLFLSRVYHPLVVYPAPPEHDSHLNKIAAELSSRLCSEHFPSFSFRKYSYNLFYVLRKK